MATDWSDFEAVDEPTAETAAAPSVDWSQYEAVPDNRSPRVDAALDLLNPAIGAANDYIFKPLGKALTGAGKNLYDSAAATAFAVTGQGGEAYKQLAHQTDELGRTPIEQGAAMQSTSGKVLSSATKGLIQSVPQMAAVAGAQALGVPAPLAGGVIFGSGEEGLDAKQAIIGSVLPVIGEFSGSIVQKIAQKLGVDSPKALAIWNKIGGVSGAAGLIGADQLKQISELPPENRKQAIIDAVGNVASMAFLGAVHPTDLTKTPPVPPVRGTFERSGRSYTTQAERDVGRNDYVPGDPSETPRVPIPDQTDPNAQPPDSQVGQSGELQPHPDASIPIAAEAMPKAAEAATDVIGSVDRTARPVVDQPVNKEEDSAVHSDVKGLAQMPVADFGVEIKKRQGGLTGDAYRLGQAVKTPEELKAIQEAQAAASAAVKEARGKKDIGTAMGEAMRGQYFREAYEAATGTGSAGRALREADPNFKPSIEVDEQGNVISKMESPKENAPKIEEPATELKPAIKTPAGEVVPGKDHVDAYEKAKETTPDTSGSQEGFQTKEGRFINREQAAQVAGVPTETEAGKLHSSDLENQKSQSQQTPAPEPQKPVAPAAEPAQSPTSIKNATVDQERAKRGLPAAVQPAKKSFGETWDKAMARIDADPTWLDGSKDKPGLIEELNNKPRPITDEEDAALLQRQIDLQNEHAKASRDMAQAQADGRTDDVNSARLREAELSDRLLELYNINKRVGTENARGLNARKMMENEDFSLAQMELTKRSANGGKPLTPQQKTEIQELHRKIQESQKVIDDLTERQKDMVSRREANAAIERIRAEKPDSDEPKVSSQILKVAQGIVDALDKRADAARIRLKERLGRTNTGVDPTILFDLAEIGASHLAHATLDFAQWSARMVDEWGEVVKPHLDEIFKMSQEAIDRNTAGKPPAVKRAVADKSATAKIDARKASIAEKVKAGDNDIAYDVQKLARKFIENGVTEREELIDRVHDALKESMPEITRREAMDAISGYGRFRQLSKEAIAVKLRGLKGEMQALAKIEDILAGKPLKRSGFEQAEPTDEKRRLDQQVEELKRRHGVVVTDADTQLKSALDAIKTGLTNQISDLQHQIDTKQKIIKERTPPPSDAETESLRAKRDALKKELDEIFPKAPISKEQRIKSALKSLQRQTSEYEKLAADKQVKAIGEKLPTTPELEAARARRDAASAAYEEMRSLDEGYQSAQEEARLAREKAALEKSIGEKEAQLASGGKPTAGKPVNRPSNPEIEPLRQRLSELNKQISEARNPKASPEARALQAAKTRTANRFAALQDKMARGDYQKNPRKVLQPDRQLMEARSQYERLKQQFRQGVNRDRLKQRTTKEKVADRIVKGVRGSILSGPTILGKLTSAALSRMIVTPAEELVGAGLSKAFPELASRAKRQGGISTTAEVKAITEAVTQGMKDSWAVLRTGKSPLDLNYGKDPGVPQSFIDFFGNLHGALKAPVKRAEFARSFQKRLEAEAKAGADVSDEFVQQGVAVKAYEDANRAIFMQKNILNDGYKRALSRFDQVNKQTGHKELAGTALGTTLRTLLPVTKVPSNIVAETMEYAVGSLTGLPRLAKAYREGIESLPPDQADLIMRQLKKGSLGPVIVLLGFLNPNVLGGFYQRGEKRKKTDIKPGAARVAGVDVPSQVLDSPLGMAAQLGATMRRVSDSKLRKRDKFTQGLSEGAIAGALGIADAIPFIRETTEFSKLMNPNERSQWLGELAKSRLVPQMLQWIAQHEDVDAKGNPVKRKPTNTLQTIETGIPILRKNVPIKRNP